MSDESSIWSDVATALYKSLPTLFDSSDDPANVLDIIESTQSSILSDVLSSIAKSYKNNSNQIKMNFPHILTFIERLIMMNRIDDARNFIDDTIDEYFNTAVDIGALVGMFIRVCPKVNPRHRAEFCNKIILSVSINLENTKCNKKLAPLLFDFSLVILDLHVVGAPKCTLYILEKKDYYPWKELVPRFGHLVRSCASYDKISEEDFSDLTNLEDILRLTVERAQSIPSILQVTHAEALRAILRWAAPAHQTIGKKIWLSYVYRMGQTMIALIDQRQLTTDICVQLIEALSKELLINDKEDDDNQEEPCELMEYFYIVSKRKRCTQKTFICEYHA